MTLDETWGQFCEPEKKAQSRQWLGPGSPRPQKAMPSASKVMATVFWDVQGAIMLNLLPKRSAITRVCYANEEVMTLVEEWVNGKDPDVFSSGLMTLEHRWSKCIIIEGNYIEKEEVDLKRK